MANNQMVQSEAKKPKFTTVINSTSYQNLIKKTLGDPERAKRFVASITSAVVTNPALSECDPSTIVSAGLLGESLNLSPSPQLGHYYMIPFNDNKNERKVAQFQLGYKGYMQLAQRSGRLKCLIAMPVKEGEFIEYNPYTNSFKAQYLGDDTLPTIGYYAMYETIDGYKQVLYWDKAKMEKHAIRYSKGYKAKKGYTFWEKDFDSMACKTMIKQLISKHGCPLAIEYAALLDKDENVLDRDGNIIVFDDEPEKYSIPADTVEEGNVVLVDTSNSGSAENMVYVDEKTGSVITLDDLEEVN